MKCVIIANGDLDHTDETRRILARAELIVCADGGARHLRALGIRPHALIGDFDSIRPEDRFFLEDDGITVISHPAQKDRTDTELCLAWAIDHQATEITFLGVTGRRMDHTLANIYLLTKLARLGIPALIRDSHNEIRIVTNHLELKGSPGDLVSLVPVSETVRGVTLTGLKYPLVEVDLERGGTLAVSNEFKEDFASIRIRQGMVLVIRSREEPSPAEKGTDRV